MGDAPFLDSDGPVGHPEVVLCLHYRQVLPYKAEVTGGSVVVVHHRYEEGRLGPTDVVDPPTVWNQPEPAKT